MPNRYQATFLFLALTAAGLVGNMLKTSLFFSVDFMFGSIAVLLVSALLGPWSGGLSALIAGSYTIAIWGHPYAALILVGEAVFAGYCLHRVSRNLLLLVSLYWLLIGMPLVWASYRFGVGLDSVNTWLIVFKQAVNGIFNALIAGLLLVQLPVLQRIAGHDRHPSLYHLLFMAFVALVLLPTLILTIVGSRTELRALETQVATELSASGQAISAHLSQWRNGHLQAVVELARLAENLDGEDLQLATESIRRSLPSLHNMYVADTRGTAIAFDPPVNPAGEETLGLNFSDRPYFAWLRRHGQPFVSDVFRGRGGTNEPIVIMAAPIFRHRVFAGFSLGAIDLSSLKREIDRMAENAGFEMTLVDRESRVITSTREDYQPLHVWPADSVEPVRTDLYQRVPEGASNSAMIRWSQSFYGKRFAVGEDGWTLILETSIAPYQRYLSGRYMRSLAIMLGLTLLSLVGARLLAHRVTGPLSRLARATRDLPGRLQSSDNLAWPTAYVREQNTLIRNFQDMSAALRTQFQALDHANNELEARSLELAVSNRQLTSEIHERERIAQGVRFLAEASMTLASSLDHEAAVRHAVELAVPELADWCVLELLHDDGNLSLASFTHRVPEKQQRGQELLPSLRLNVSSLNYIRRAIEKQEWVLVPQVEAAELEANLHTDAARAAWELGFSSALVVPCVTKGRALGALVLVAISPERRYGRVEIELAQDFAHRVAMALDNARLYDELERAIHLRDEFLSIASHELRTPLTSLMLQLQSSLLDLERNTGTPQRFAAKLERSKVQALRLNSLVDTLLDVSRIQNGRLSLDPEYIDLAQLAREVVDRYEAEPPESLQLTTDGPVVGCWDRLRLEQVLVNLVSNALKYGNGNPVELRVHIEGPRAVLHVRDQGIGISPEAQKSIFGRFERAVSSDYFGGLGLGLYITEQIVALHGGSIDVESTPGKGTTFTVELPLEHPPGKTPPTAV